MDKYEYKYDFKTGLLIRTKDGVSESKEIEIHNSEEFLQAIREWE